MEKLVLKDILGTFEIDLVNGSIREVENSQDYIDLGKQINNEKFSLQSKYNEKILSTDCGEKIIVKYHSDIENGKIILKRTVEVYYFNFFLFSKTFSVPFFPYSLKKVLKLAISNPQILGVLIKYSIKFVGDKIIISFKPFLLFSARYRYV
jgi:hypothetical protein